MCPAGIPNTTSPSLPPYHRTPQQQARARPGQLLMSVLKRHAIAWRPLRMRLTAGGMSAVTTASPQTSWAAWVAAWLTTARSVSRRLTPAGWVGVISGLLASLPGPCCHAGDCQEQCPPLSCLLLPLPPVAAWLRALMGLPLGALEMLYAFVATQVAHSYAHITDISPCLKARGWSPAWRLAAQHMRARQQPCCAVSGIPDIVQC